MTYSKLVFQRVDGKLVVRAGTIKAHMKDCARQLQNCTQVQFYKLLAYLTECCTFIQHMNNPNEDIRFTLMQIAGIQEIEELEQIIAPGGGETVLPL